ncbi:MAG: DUF1631 family protein [Pseudomonadaceae bacterium]|nr:DUF1631 family protein [Pseudomonadaceae bacterium]
MNTPERRQYARQPISLSALVHPQEGRSWLCSIRDFCETGLLLTASSSGRSIATSHPHLKAGDDVSVHFSVATPTGQQHFRSSARIARMTPTAGGLGVFFPNGLPEGAFDAMIDYGVAAGMVSASAVGRDTDDDLDLHELTAPNAQAKAGGKPSGEGAVASGLDAMRDQRINKQQADFVRRRVRRVLERFAQRLAGQFSERAEQDVLVKARDAGTNAVQMMYFEGLDLLEKNRAEIAQTLSAELLSQMDEVADLERVLEQRRRQETGSTNKLELVDTEQFEGWLAVAEVISKAENRYSDVLFDIRLRLGLVAKPWTHKDVAPVSPSVITWAFDSAISDIEFRRQVRAEIFRDFETALMPLLDGLYTAVGRILDEADGLPSLEELKTSYQRSVLKPVASGAIPDPQAYAEMEPAAREAAMAADGVGGRVGHNPFDKANTIAPARRAAKDLLELTRETQTRLGKPPAIRLAAADSPSDARFDTQDILGAISEIELETGHEPLSGDRLKNRLVDVLRQRYGDRKALTPEDYDNLDLMEQLVDAMRNDQLITSGIRQWIQRLELTLNKLAARDPQFLAEEGDSSHSAVQMLNQLGRLGNAEDLREGIDREVGSRVDELLSRVVSEYDDNPEVFSEVVNELNPLIDRQSRTYRGNIERTVRSSEGQQQLARARRSVLTELGGLLDGREVPELALELINPGWRNLLTHAFLRHGEDSAEYRDSLALIEQMLAHLDGSVDPNDDSVLPPEELLSRVVSGLDSISFDPAKRTPLVMRLSDVLVGDATGKKAPVRTRAVSEQTLIDDIGLGGLLPETNPAIETDDESVRRSWDAALDRARRIRVGEWLATGDVKGRPLILSVAFVGDENANFVLVNRKGLKAQELTLQAMTDGLHDGQVTLLEDHDLPLMERASQRMLENMHNQLAYQASHDELTSLLNRREFERVVEGCINRSRTDSSEHSLMYLDMDQFKIINNTSGHNAGDALLQIIGERLGTALGDAEAHVARLGGDEFGVLVENVDADAARDAATKLLNTVRDERFTWEGRHYSLSASIGLVFLDESMDDADAALRLADEACYTAKDAGRNRIQEYELGDKAMMHRHGVMEWVTQLDKALDEDRLVLNCQRIAPVADATAASHYEVLLTMRDELGDLMPPSDFILAAETYNRMPIIDRWVINQVLDWMAERRESLDSFAGFAINISGHSINDETFPDFVLDAFARTQAPTGKVCFEITETAAIANLDNAVDFMNRMKIIGCRFSLDDFGTGLSSYSYLRNLPVDYVKIDGVFVKDIDSNPGDYAVVRSINEIGHYMGKRTIAEYVETDSVMNALKEIGVDFAQGFGIEKPILLEQFRP